MFTGSDPVGGDGFLERFYDELLVGGVEVREERERERSRARVFGDRAHALREAVGLAHVRLEMDGRHVVARLDALRLEALHDALAVDPRRKLDDVDEPRAPVVGVVREWRLDAIDTPKQTGVPRGRRTTHLEHPVELLQLTDPECRLDVREPVVEADPRVVEPARVVRAALVAKADEQVALLLGVRRDHSALAGRQLLVRIEAERARRHMRADRTALVLRARRTTRAVCTPPAV